MTLDKVKRGNKIRIVRINNKDLKTQAIRIGIYEGADFLCSERLAGGPVILQNRMQEVAIGKRLAESIEVEGV
ncbi:MAG: ferrous iron transport protein A [Clostridiaceae bacterium]|jgi:ferrous iron transport protein A|nr:ferrous iron transport protein A [Clostridiaceae bacterium]